MNLIKAFVGHSFAPEDSEVVEKFLKFFSRLEGMNSNFSWVHAEAAEPKQLADKVMALIKDKNLFIGICTKKEFVVAFGDVSKVPLLNKQIANSENLEWKTSDWIIQEIGLARGRDLEILLLIESGVRKPGGLQGDVEYISFDRSTPETAFGKIIEMITALAPQTTAVVTVLSSPTSPPVDEERQIAPDNDWTVPSPSWRRQQYELAMFHFIYQENDEEAKKIDEAFLATAEAEDLETAAAWRAHNHGYRLLFGRGGDLTALQALANEFPNNAEIRQFHARALSKFGKHLDAAGDYEIAALKANDMSDRARFWGYAAAEYARDGKATSASTIIIMIRQSLISGEINESQFLYAFNSFAEVTKNKDLLIAIYERLVDLSPDDFRTRFALAYMHSEVGNDDLSLNHYLKIPPNERGKLDWNNLGAAFQHFRLPIKSAQAYRKSEGMGETLAMANLGYKMLSVGLLSEARAICEKALAIENYHKNVSQLLVKLNEASQEEDKTLEEAIEKSRSKVEFFRCFGRAVSLAEPKKIDGSWVSPECVVNVVTANGKIEISGSYEQDANPFGVAVGMLSLRRTTRHRVDYKGTFDGRAVLASVSRSEDGGSPPVSLLSASGDGKTLMYVSDDETEIRMIENPSGTFPKMFVLKRPDAELSVASIAN